MNSLLQAKSAVKKTKRRKKLLNDTFFAHSKYYRSFSLVYVFYKLCLVCQQKPLRCELGLIDYIIQLIRFVLFHWLINNSSFQLPAIS